MSGHVCVIPSPRRSLEMFARRRPALRLRHARSPSKAGANASTNPSSDDRRMSGCAVALRLQPSLAQLPSNLRYAQPDAGGGVTDGERMSLIERNPLVVIGLG